MVIFPKGEGIVYDVSFYFFRGRVGWQETGQSHEVPELSFQIGN